MDVAHLDSNYSDLLNKDNYVQRCLEFGWPNELINFSLFNEIKCAYNLIIAGALDALTQD